MGVRRSFPILTTRDLVALESFYVTAFGAERTYAFPDGDHDAYVALRLGESELGIALDVETADRPVGAALWIYVDDVDESFRRAVESGAASVSEPALMPWGEWVAEISDPAGFIVHLGAEPS